MSLNRITNYDDLFAGGESIQAQDMFVCKDLNIMMKRTPPVLPGAILRVDNGGNIVWTQLASVPGGSVSHIKTLIRNTVIDSENFKEIEMDRDIVVGSSGGVTVEDDKYISFTGKGIYLIFVNYQNKIRGNSVCYEMKTQIKYDVDNTDPTVGFDYNIGLCTTPVFKDINAEYFNNASGRNLYNTTTTFSLNTNNVGVNTYLRFLCRKISDTYQDGEIMPLESTISIIRLT